MAKRKSAFVNFIEIPIEKIHMAEWNYKTYTDKKLQKKLVNNIKKNGLIENIIVREIDNGDYEVVNGHHRYLAMQELKYDKIMCYNLGPITDLQAKRIAIETNETKFETDKDKLAELIYQINEEFSDFDSTNPFNDKETEKLLALLEKTDVLNDETQVKKGPKSKTLLTAAGESYTTVKLEIPPELAERFYAAMSRFTSIGGAVSQPLDIMLQLVELYTDEKILKLTGHHGKKLKDVSH